ncbi:MAG: hypothetical protein EP307_05395 [Rhodobacteraceae bacterium]|nr:MAG: hypothetical protein EP307_05395 [Paracoccaceae bacterium]
MPRYNTQFELDVDDIDLIETALRDRKKYLSLQRLTMISGDGSTADPEGLAAIDAAIGATHDLLGRLHNQKVFYRPTQARSAPYISG